MTPAASIRTLGLVLVLLSTLGCDEDWRTVELDLHSLGAADSVAAGTPLAVQFNYFATGEDQFSSYTWDAVDDSTIRLRVFHRFREDGPAIGAPAFLTSSDVVLPDPPTRSFRILAGELWLEVEGGIAPSDRSRLTVVVLEDGQPLPGVELRLTQLTDAFVPDSVLLPPTDAEGMTGIENACLSSAGRFQIDAEGSQFSATANGRWPRDCAGPLRLVVRGRRLAVPTER